jgi:hypothetical protein
MGAKGNTGGVPYPPKTVEEYGAYVKRLLKRLRPDEKGRISKRGLRDALRWHATISACEVWQVRPWTATKAVVVLYDVPFHETRFSKVCVPDKWDEERGIAVALGKAVCAAVRENIAAWSPAQWSDVAERLAGELADELDWDSTPELVSYTDIVNPYRPCTVI